MNKLPIFVSHYSLGNSILTLEEAEDINNESPISIFSIAKTHNLQQIHIADRDMGGFLQAYQNANKLNAQLIYGIKIKVCNDRTDKTDESLLTESKVIIWLKNSAAYKDILKIYNDSYKNGFYYTNRTDWKTIQSLWTENLLMSIPFYGSFLFNNLLKFNYQVVPNFGNIQPFLHVEDHGLPFDNLIQDSVDNLAKTSNMNKVDSHTVYYYSPEQFKSYMVFRCIFNRSTFNNPNIDFLASDKFSFLDCI